MYEVIHILHFEDSLSDHKLLKLKLNRILNIKFDHQSTLYNAGALLSSSSMQYVDIIICDYYFPKIRASEIIELLHRANKLVIFLTGEKRKVVYDDIFEKIGHIPSKFKYVSKTSSDSVFQITELIKDFKMFDGRD